MRREPLVGLVLIACNPRPPEAEAPAPAPVPTESAQNAAGDKQPEPAPAKPAPAFQSPAKISGDLAPNLELGDAERAAVAAACKELYPLGDYTCDATRPLPDYLLLRARGKAGKMVEYMWYVLKRHEGRWMRMDEPLESFSDGTDAQRWPAIVCAARIPAEPLPAELGVVRVMHPDLNLDGSDDLLTECRSQDGDHDLRYCLSSRNLCEERLWLRSVRSGKTIIDLDAEFRDGWFVRTVRTDLYGDIKGNLRVEGVTTPDPVR